MSHRRSVIAPQGSIIVPSLEMGRVSAAASAEHVSVPRALGVKPCEGAAEEHAQVGTGCTTTHCVSNGVSERTAGSGVALSRRFTFVGQVLGLLLGRLHVWQGYV